MPLNPGKNKGVLIFGLVLLMAVVLLGYLSSLDEKGDGSPSSYSTKKNGGKAAYLFLLQSGLPISRWENTPRELPKDPTSSVLILADPERLPDPEEQGAISRYVNAGGRVLVTGQWVNSLLLPHAAKVGERRVGHAECKPVAPTTLTRSGTITQEGFDYWDDGGLPHVVHFADDKGKPVVISFKSGKGEVIWWASALPLTNVGIRDKHNVELLLASVGDSQRILWDEYFHDSRVGAVRRSHRYAQVLRWGWWQLAALAIVVIFSYSRRSGPIVPASQPSRLSPLEFVQTMGSVFNKAGASQVAVEIAFGRLRQVAARRLGLRPDADAVEIGNAMRQRSFAITEELAISLREAQSAIDDLALREPSAIAHVCTINRVLAILEKDRAAHV